VGLPEAALLLVAAEQEVHLRLEGVARPVAVEVLEERVLLHLLEHELRREPVREHARETRLARPDHALDHQVTVLGNAHARGSPGASRAGSPRPSLDAESAVDADGLGFVGRRGAHDRPFRPVIQVLERLANVRLAVAEIGTQSDERPHAVSLELLAAPAPPAPRSRVTSMIARPPVVQPRFCFAMRTHTRWIPKRSRMMSASFAASASSRWKLSPSTTSRTVR